MPSEALLPPEQIRDHRLNRFQSALGLVVPPAIGVETPGFWRNADRLIARCGTTGPAIVFRID